jgi:hypothetical protein
VITTMEWWSIEVLNGSVPAARWKDAHGTLLVEAALTNGAADWAWHEHRWGVVLELAFPDEWRWERFSELPEPDPDPLEVEALEPGRAGPGFYDERPEPSPAPSPSDEPAAG